jgi:hypothetical protein
MALQFCNIYRTTYIKSVSRVNNAIKTTTLKNIKKNSKRRRQVGHSLTAKNLAFLRSLNAI